MAGAAAASGLLCRDHARDPLPQRDRLVTDQLRQITGRGVVLASGQRPVEVHDDLDKAAGQARRRQALGGLVVGDLGVGYLPTGRSRDRLGEVRVAVRDRGSQLVHGVLVPLARQDLRARARSS